LKCPECGKELEEVTVIQSLSCEEKSSYRKVEGSENVFEYTEVVDRDVFDAATEGVECPYCGARLEVERFFDGKVELK
jgi:hypothetical protein